MNAITFNKQKMSDLCLQLKNGNYCHKESPRGNGYLPEHLKQKKKSKEKISNKLDQTILESIPSFPSTMSDVICQYSFSDLVLKNLDSFYQYLLDHDYRISDENIVNCVGEIVIPLRNTKSLMIPGMESELKKHILKDEKLPYRHKFIFQVVCFSIYGESKFRTLPKNFISNAFSFGSYKIELSSKMETVKTDKIHAIQIMVRKGLSSLKIPEDKISDIDNLILSISLAK